MNLFGFFLLALSLCTGHSMLARSPAASTDDGVTVEADAPAVYPTNTIKLFYPTSDWKTLEAGA